MNRFSLFHLADPDLLRGLRSLVAQDRTTTAMLVAHLAEVDARRLYADAGYPSMFTWCVAELGLAADAAYRRIQAARVARRFPAVFDRLADGRLNLTAVILLAPYLSEANAGELLAAVAGRTRTEIDEWLAHRFPRTDLLPLVTGLPVEGPAAMGSNGTDSDVTPPTDGDVQFDLKSLALERVKLSVTQPARVEAAPPARLAPTAPGRYSLQLTISGATHEKLRHAQAMLGHAVPSGEIAQVLDRALDALIRQLERRKCAATDRPRPRSARRISRNPRHVPADVRREVWRRDGGQCTFVSAAGHRCEARHRLEFDHVEPVARGGRATVNGMRLRCRAHNQYAAECAFGAGFMSHKREAAQHAAEPAHRRAAAAAAEETRVRAAAAEEARARAAAAAEEARVRAAAAAEVVPWLRTLGMRADEARRAAECCEAMPDAPLEERLRHALKCFGRPRTTVTRPAA